MLGLKLVHVSKRAPKVHIDGLAQDCTNSTTSAMELPQSCAKPSMFSLVSKAAVATEEIHLKSICNSNLVKSSLIAAPISVILLFENFAESTAVTLSCSMQNLEMIGQLSWELFQYKYHLTYKRNHMIKIRHLISIMESPISGKIDRLEQERRNSGALAPELHLSCTNPSRWRLHWNEPQAAMGTQWFTRFEFKLEDFTCIFHIPTALGSSISISILMTGCATRHDTDQRNHNGTLYTYIYSHSISHTWLNISRSINVKKISC